MILKENVNIYFIAACFDKCTAFEKENDFRLMEICCQGITILLLIIPFFEGVVNWRVRPRDELSVLFIDATFSTSFCSF